MNNNDSDRIRLRNGTIVHKASHDTRMNARIIDTLIMGIAPFIICFFVITASFECFMADCDEIGLAGPVVAVGLTLIIGVIRYEPVRIARRGQTFGKRRAEIKVVSFEDGSLPSIWTALVRWAVPTGLGMCLVAVVLLILADTADTSDLTSTPAQEMVLIILISFVLGLMSGIPVAWMLMYIPSLYDKNGRGLHDRIAGTIVIEAEPRNRNRV